MSFGSEFQAVGPLTEDARSLSLVLVDGTVCDRFSVDERSRVVEMRQQCSEQCC